MAINFSDRVLVTNPTVHHLGRAIVFLGAVLMAVGVITCYTGDVLLPALAWCAWAVPTIAVGIIFVFSGLTRP
jgi:hypothetical protein